MVVLQTVVLQMVVLLLVVLQMVVLLLVVLQMVVLLVVVLLLVVLQMVVLQTVVLLLVVLLLVVLQMAVCAPRVLVVSPLVEENQRIQLATMNRGPKCPEDSTKKKHITYFLRDSRWVQRDQTVFHVLGLSDASLEL
jgi:hypothetical protein